MDINEVQKKLQKLLALATSPNEHEAALAMERAAEIAAKYDLDLALIEEGQVGPKMSINEMNGTTRKYSKYTAWEATLCNSIAYAFECRVVVLRDNNPWKYAILGRESDVELVSYFQIFLRDQIRALGYANYSVSVNERTTYFAGAVHIVGKRLNNQFKKKKAEAIVEATGKDLVVSKEADTKNFVDMEFPNLRKGRGSSLTGSREAWNKGVSDGEKVNLNRPVEGGSNARIGG